MSLLTTQRRHVTLTQPMGGHLKTSRFVIACAIAVALCAGIESTLLAALRSSDDAAAASRWATHLNVSDLQDASLRIHTYPYFYRRAIMSALEPDDRSRAWRRYLVTYAAAHPELDVAGRALLSRASATMTPELFDDNPPAARLAELASIYDLSLTLLGRRATTDVFLRLGPDDTGIEALPVTERVSLTMRRWLAVSARGADCECSAALSASCDAAGAAGDTCTATASCEPVVTWPMCGLVWALPCDGVCTNTRHGAPTR